jgi:hypothetical protein
VKQGRSRDRRVLAVAPCLRVAKVASELDGPRKQPSRQPEVRLVPGLAGLLYRLFELVGEPCLRRLNQPTRRSYGFVDVAGLKVSAGEWP